MAVPAPEATTGVAPAGLAPTSDPEAESGAATADDSATAAAREGLATISDSAESEEISAAAGQAAILAVGQAEIFVAAAEEAAIFVAAAPEATSSTGC